MREILFRGKRIDNGEWVEGAFLNDRDGAFYICPAVSDITYGDNGNRRRIGCWYRVDPNTVGQYTGLTDKNGKRIFEGDILRYTGFNMTYDDICYVVFDCAEFALKFVTMDKRTMAKKDLEKLGLQKGLFDFCVGRNSFEVIGTIHDNPELLEEEPT